MTFNRKYGHTMQDLLFFPSQNFYWTLLLQSVRLGVLSWISYIFLLGIVPEKWNAHSVKVICESMNYVYYDTLCVYNTYLGSLCIPWPSKKFQINITYVHKDVYILYWIITWRGDSSLVITNSRTSTWSDKSKLLKVNQHQLESTQGRF